MEDCNTTIKTIVKTVQLSYYCYHTTRLHKDMTNVNNI